MMIRQRVRRRLDSREGREHVFGTVFDLPKDVIARATWNNPQVHAAASIAELSPPELNRLAWTFQLAVTAAIPERRLLRPRSMARPQTVRLGNAPFVDPWLSCNLPVDDSPEEGDPLESELIRRLDQTLVRCEFTVGREPRLRHVWTRVPNPDLGLVWDRRSRHARRNLRNPRGAFQRAMASNKRCLDLLEGRLYGLDKQLFGRLDR